MFFTKSMGDMSIMAVWDMIYVSHVLYCTLEIRQEILRLKKTDIGVL